MTRVNGIHRCKGRIMFTLSGEAIWTEVSEAPCDQPLLAGNILGVPPFPSWNPTLSLKVATGSSRWGLPVLQWLVAAVSLTTTQNPFSCFLNKPRGFIRLEHLTAWFPSTSPSNIIVPYKEGYFPLKVSRTHNPLIHHHYFKSISWTHCKSHNRL